MSFLFVDATGNFCSGTEWNDMEHCPGLSHKQLFFYLHCKYFGVDIVVVFYVFSVLTSHQVTIYYKIIFCLY